MSRIEALTRRSRELFDRIWPSGIPIHEAVVFDAVPSADRGMVLDRIEAAWRGEQGEPWAPLAEMVGLKRAGYFNLKRAWREHGVAGVVPNGRQKPRGIMLDEDHPLRGSTDALLRSEGGKARNVEIARRLMLEAGWALTDSNEYAAALQRLERLVQHSRKALARNPEFVRRTYGSGILVDLTAVAIQLIDEGRQHAVVAVVVEEATGLILGSALGTSAEAIHLQRAAFVEAKAFLETRGADVGADAEVDLNLTLPPQVEKETLSLDRLCAEVRDLSVQPPGGSHFGRALGQLTGPRIGRIRLARRRTLDVDSVEYRKTRNVLEFRRVEAEATWRREVIRHNSPVEGVMKAVGILDGEVGRSGRMIAILEALDTTWATLRAVNA